jgi:hypothetical protein
MIPAALFLIFVPERGLTLPVRERFSAVVVRRTPR